MNLILLGAPGSGKGTQASLLAKKYDIPHISTGDILRSAIKEKTPLGLRAKEYMDKGQLVPDELVVGIIKRRFEENDVKNGFMLDGFPRTLMQAKTLDSMFLGLNISITAVIDIEVRDKEIINRLTARRVCADCKKVYNLIFESPENENFCDKCGGRLLQRSDDSMETVKNRLAVYKDQTQPLINYYKNKNLLKSVNGEQTKGEVFADIEMAIKGGYA